MHGCAHRRLVRPANSTHHWAGGDDSPFETGPSGGSGDCDCSSLLPRIFSAARLGQSSLQALLNMSQTAPSIAPITAPIIGMTRSLKRDSRGELEIGEVDSWATIIPKNMHGIRGPQWRNAATTLSDTMTSPTISAGQLGTLSKTPEQSTDSPSAPMANQRTLSTMLRRGLVGHDVIDATMQFCRRGDAVVIGCDGDSGGIIRSRNAHKSRAEVSTKSIICGHSARLTLRHDARGIIRGPPRVSAPSSSLIAPCPCFHAPSRTPWIPRFLRVPAPRREAIGGMDRAQRRRCRGAKQNVDRCCHVLC